MPIPKLVPSNHSALPLVATLEPFKYNTPLAVPPERASVVLIVAEDEVRVVMLAEAMLRLESTKLVAVRFVIDADAAFRSTKDPSAQVRLLGFVPSSTTALAEVMENIRLSAVLTATSAPPARLVRLAVPGTEPGVSLFFRRIVGISRCLRSNCLWR